MRWALLANRLDVAIDQSLAVGRELATTCAGAFRAECLEVIESAATRAFGRSSGALWAYVTCGTALDARIRGIAAGWRGSAWAAWEINSTADASAHGSTLKH